MISCTPDQIHYQTSRYIIAILSHKMMYICTQFLTKKERSNHKNVGEPIKPDVSQQPECNNKKHRDMNGQHPLQVEFLYMHAPVPERNIE